MKNIFTLCFFLLGFIQLSGQLVTTVAGVVEIAGDQDGPALEATFSNPHGIAADPEGNIYVADRFGHKIRRISTDGMVTTLAGSGQIGSADGIGQTASFHEPWGICVGSDGNIYVADTRNNLIRKITPSGIVTTFAGSGNYGTTDGFGLSATFGNPTGIEMDEAGNLFVADHLTHIIRKIDPTGFVSTLAGLPYTPGALDGSGNNALFYRPYGLTLDNQGNILVADEWNHRIRKITPTGTVSTIAGNGNIGHVDGNSLVASFNYPWDITVDSLDNIYVVDGYNQVIRRIVPSVSVPVSYTVSTYAGTVNTPGGQDGFGNLASFNGATGLAYLRANDEIFVADAYNNLIRKVTIFQQQNIGLVVANQGGSSFCQEEIVTLSAVPVNFQTYTFYVDNQISQTGDSPDFTFSDLLPGPHSFQVIATDAGGTYESDILIIDILPPPVPTITIVGNQTFFEGDSVVLVSDNAVEYLWSNGATTPTITVRESGEYWVEIMDENGCLGISESVVVDVLIFSSPPSISFLQGNEILCYDETAILASSYSENNQWLLDGWPITGETNQTFEVSVAGNYQVQITDSLGFTFLSNEIEITILPPLLEDFSADRIFLTENNNLVQFSSIVNDSVSFEWDFGDPDSGLENFSQEENPVHRYESPGIYSVQLVVKAGDTCSETMRKENYIEYRASETDEIIYIPNTFTPNGDDVNDLFFVRGETIENLELYIYNQWGEEIFSTTSIEEGWDGSCTGQLVQNGTYAYLAKITMYSGNIITKTGSISLIR